MKRAFDLTLAVTLFIIFFIPMILISLVILLTSKGPIIYWSDRVGVDNSIFSMPKFRSMKIDTPEVASHLLFEPDKFLSPVGRMLRKTSLDELPQLFSVIQGHMSFIGPRPALISQDDLIELRAMYGLDSLIPGITGWAQVNGRDSLTIKEKVIFETEYAQNKTFWLDVKILWLTCLKVFKSNEISH